MRVGRVLSRQPFGRDDALEAVRAGVHLFADVGAELSRGGRDVGLDRDEEDGPALVSLDAPERDVVALGAVVKRESVPGLVVLVLEELSPRTCAETRCS